MSAHLISSHSISYYFSPRVNIFISFIGRYVFIQRFICIRTKNKLQHLSWNWIELFNRLYQLCCISFQHNRGILIPYNVTLRIKFCEIGTTVRLPAHSAGISRTIPCTSEERSCPARPEADGSARILVRRRFSTRTRRVVGTAIGKMRWEEKLVQVVCELPLQPTANIPDATRRARYVEYAVTRLLGIDICRDNTRKFGGFESNALVLLHIRPEPPFNVSGREWDISLLLLARDSSGSIIYGRIFKHRDHTCACFMCRTRPLKILLSGDDFFDSDSPILMSASTAIDSIHNTRRKGRHEGRKSMNNKSLRNYFIIIMKYVIFKVDVTYHESFISIVF